MIRFFYILLFFAFIFPVGCTKTIYVDYLYSPATPKNYFSKSEEVTVEVYYETGAQPYDGTFSSGTRDLWEILEENLSSIFQYRTQMPTLHVPMTIAEMTEVADSNSTGWTIDEMLSYHKSHKGPNPTETHARFYFYFVRGLFENNDGQTQPQVIGLNITNTPVLFIFKDVIRNTATSLPPVLGDVTRRFVEQSTLVHEMGHALGLVNNGVPMHEDHQDVAHGAHTLNPDCVMYYLNEGASDMADFVQELIASGSVILWGPEVLADVQAFSK